MKSEFKRRAASQMTKMTAGALAAMALAGAAAKADAADISCVNNKICNFKMVRPKALANLTNTCLPNASAAVTVVPGNGIEIMTVNVKNLRPNTNYDFFVIQVPAAPFGLAWYQGDIHTNSSGSGSQTFMGRFNEETFIVAQPGAVPSPLVHDQQPPAFRDGFFGETTQVGPIHTFHLGLWFNSPADAVAAGCPGGTTPFNGEHNAGIQILNTSNFADQKGPLINIKP
jgi:hypothetical protein